MDKKFDVWVKQHKEVKTEKGIEYTVKLESPSGHYLVLKSKTKDIYEGLPIGQTVTVKIVDMQSTLPTG